MQIKVTAHPDAGQAKVSKIDKSTFEVWVKEAPRNNLANYAIRQALANYFQSDICNVRITSGFRQRNKVIEVK